MQIFIEEDEEMNLKEYIRGAVIGPEKGDKVEYFNLKGRISCNVLTNSQQSIPSPCYHYDADITKFYNEYRKLKETCGYPLSFNTLMMKVLVEGLAVAPRLNAHMHYNHSSGTGKLIIKEHIDVAMPIFFPDGVTYPIKIRGLENKTLEQISQRITETLDRLEKTDLDGTLFDVVTQRMVGYTLKGKIVPAVKQIATGFFGKYKVNTVSGFLKKQKQHPDALKVDDLNESTVCLTNWGPLYEGLSGSVSYTPILYPMVFLMAIGNIRDTEYVFKKDDGTLDLGTKKLLPITLMFDHRIGGFGDVMPFIKKLDEIFANPEIIQQW
ncbi:MAG: 2-oxo acid dehydrogenase subunit E2 [Acutalibacteraceae bacterium]